MLAKTGSIGGVTWGVSLASRVWQFQFSQEGGTMISNARSSRSSYLSAIVFVTIALVCALHALDLCTPAVAQEAPSEYQEVLKSLGKQGDYKANVLKINIPRSDLKVTVDGVNTPTPFGFGGWLAMTKGDGGMDVMMGDLVLLQDEVNPVMSALLDNGLEVTALHNHFFFDEPRRVYMHVMGHGTAADLARMAKPAVDLIGKVTAAPAAPQGKPLLQPGKIDTVAIAKIVGAEGEQSGSVC